VLHGGVDHWRNLANTIEPSMCGGDADFFVETLTNCYLSSLGRIAVTYVDAGYCYRPSNVVCRYVCLSQ